MSLLQGLLLAGAWAGYFAVHSLLASLRVKRWVSLRHPGWMPGYRVFFNVLAVALLAVPVGLTLAWRGELLWQWTGAAWWVANAAALLAVLGFLWSLRFYDGSEFLGLRQWRERARQVEDQEVLRISPLHRFVRHPWYSLGLVLIWTRGMDPAVLISASLITAYFVVGSRLEERKLLELHGDAYRAYRERVPSLVPLPWRYLDRETARALERRAAGREESRRSTPA
jgi:protein-S-isoprenylcysteine O-methyltransferase Ste14